MISRQDIVRFTLETAKNGGDVGYTLLANSERRLDYAIGLLEGRIDLTSAPAASSSSSTSQSSPVIYGALPNSSSIEQAEQILRQVLDVETNKEKHIPEKTKEAFDKVLKLGSGFAQDKQQHEAASEPHRFQVAYAAAAIALIERVSNRKGVLSGETEKILEKQKEEYSGTMEAVVKLARENGIGAKKGLQQDLEQAQAKLAKIDPSKDPNDHKRATKKVAALDEQIKNNESEIGALRAQQAVIAANLAAGKATAEATLKAKRDAAVADPNLFAQEAARQRKDSSAAIGAQSLRSSAVYSPSRLSSAIYTVPPPSPPDGADGGMVGHGRDDAAAPRASQYGAPGPGIQDQNPYGQLSLMPASEYGQLTLSESTQTYGNIFAHMPGGVAPAQSEYSAVTLSPNPNAPASFAGGPPVIPTSAEYSAIPASSTNNEYATVDINPDEVLQAGSTVYSPVPGQAAAMQSGPSASDAAYSSLPAGVGVPQNPPRQPVTASGDANQLLSAAQAAASSEYSSLPAGVGAPQKPPKPRSGVAGSPPPGPAAPDPGGHSRHNREQPRLTSGPSVPPSAVSRAHRETQERLSQDSDDMVMATLHRPTAGQGRK